MPLTLIDGQATYHASRHKNRRPLLLLIHGAGGSHLDWPPQLRRIDQLGSCAIDLPGHGRSASPARASISDYADVVLSLAKTLDLNEIVLVGHSMGGAIALDIALRRPEAVIGLILVASGGRLKVKQTLLELVGSDYQGAIENISAAAWGPDAPAELVDRGSRLMLACDPVALQMDFSACNSFDVMSRLDDIEMPTLVLVGAEDKMTPPKFGQFLARQIPQAEFVSFAGAGHMLAAEQPEQVSAVMKEFVQRRLQAG